jgi:LacI family transcriptional regulator
MKNASNERKVIAFLFSSPDREADEYKIGVLQYARPTKDWAFVQCASDKIVHDLQRRDGYFDGGIGEFGTPELAAAARKARFPVVNLYGGLDFEGLPTVGVDDQAIGRMAAEHLTGQGLQHFAYFGLAKRGFSSGRRRGFAAELEKYGFQVDVFDHSKKYPLRNKVLTTHIPGEYALAGWLQSLPLPCGIFCCDDMRAEWVSVEARNIGLRVPDEIAILGVDNNPVHCESSLPRLSSISLPTRQVGCEAAKILESLLANPRAKKTGPVLLPPESVVARESTDLLAVENPHLVKALKYIRSHAHTGKLRVPEVVAQTGYCRRILEAKFSQCLGRTIFQEIRRNQVEHSQRLLRETNETMASIAETAGWGSASHFGVEFKKITGLSPGEYRKTMR